MADRGRRAAGAARRPGELRGLRPLELPAALRDRRLLTGAAAALLVLVVFAAGALVGGWRPFSAQPDVYTFGPGGDLSAFTLFDGQCATGRLGAGASYTDAANAPCGNPHDIEVVGTGTPLNSSREVSYPGAAAFAEFGRAFCAMVVASGQVAPSAGGVDKSDLEVAAVVPAQAVFDEPNGTASGSSGGRLVSCVVSRSDGEKLTDRFSVI